MGEQGLRCGEFELEPLAQELAELVLDAFRFVSWPDEAKQKVVRVANISEPSKLRIVGGLRAKVLGLLAQGHRPLLSTASPEIRGPHRKLHVYGIGLTLGPSIACRQ